MVKEEGESGRRAANFVQEHPWSPAAKFTPTYYWKELDPLWNQKRFIPYYYLMYLIWLWWILNREMRYGEMSKVSDLWELASEFYPG